MVLTMLNVISINSLHFPHSALDWVLFYCRPHSDSLVLLFYVSSAGITLTAAQLEQQQKQLQEAQREAGALREKVGLILNVIHVLDIETKLPQSCILTFVYVLCTYQLTMEVELCSVCI